MLYQNHELRRNDVLNFCTHVWEVLNSLFPPSAETGFYCSAILSLARTSECTLPKSQYMLQAACSYVPNCTALLREVTQTARRLTCTQRNLDQNTPSPGLWLLVHYFSPVPWLKSWWSRGSVLAFGTQGRGFKPCRSLRIFQSEKILTTPSFGREVKPFVPCRIFAACKNTRKCMRGNRRFRSKLPAISRPSSSSFHY